MASINCRGGKLYMDFRYQGIRCREQTLLPDTYSNKQILQKTLKQLEADMKLGTFVYADYFPSSSRVDQFLAFDLSARENKAKLHRDYFDTLGALQGNEQVYFEDFANEWFQENEIRWRKSYKETTYLYLEKYLFPVFGPLSIQDITRVDIIKFRTQLIKPRNQDKEKHSAEFINHVMTPLRMILHEAALRYDFQSPFHDIKPLRVERCDVHPFSLDEVILFVNSVREDFKNYYTVRFFTGMRTCEIDGLRWEYVDFKNRTISIQKSWVNGREEGVKTSGSARQIAMSSIVYEALKAQQLTTGLGEYVFTNEKDQPLDRKNVRNRIWKPTLKKLGLRYRRPYETRHTAATLWLASGEAPEWIARQMGHSSTKMLFTVYSRFVPNLTRQDGSAFETLLAQTRKKQ